MGIAQMTVAIALISGFSVAGLGAGLALIQNEQFVLSSPFKRVFAVSLVAFLIAAFATGAAVVTRLTDFRLTARKVRKDEYPVYDKSLTFIWLKPDAYGRITWWLFSTGCVALLVGVLSLVACVVAAYPNRWN